MSAQALSNLLPIAVMLAAVYFLLIRPQQQRQKRTNEMLAKLEPGAEIVTIGGIFGRLVEVGDERLRIEVADGSQLEIARAAVRSVITPADEDLDELDEAAAEEDEPGDEDTTDEPAVADEADDSEDNA